MSLTVRGVTIFAAIALAFPAASQTVTGVVSDELGAPLAGYRVILTEDAAPTTPVLQGTTTDTQGRYTFTGLAAGAYAVAVQRNEIELTRRTAFPIAAGRITSVNLTVVVRVLAQFAIGGGWSTSIVVNNIGGTSRIAMEFLRDDGSALPVRLSATDTLDAVKSPTVVRNGTQIFQFESTGALVQGWVRLYVPDGFGVYGVFRQSVAGRANQEAVVPVAGNLSRRSILTFDNRGLTTAAAIVNPSDVAVTVTATYYVSGGLVNGRGSITIPPNNKTALTISSFPGLNLTERNYGSVVLSTNTGGLAVLGLRFGSEAFTSIPVDQYYEQ